MSDAPDDGRIALQRILVPVDHVPRPDQAVVYAATAGAAGILEALRGSVTEQVLRRASCPLLAVPARTP